MPPPEFVSFPKIPRFARDCIITEKIDGTNGVVWVGDDGEVVAGSRNRWLTVESDNFGFAAWVAFHKEQLRGLGPGLHYGEWWGAGIQRGYGLTEKRFSLFNTTKWNDPIARPKCCGVVPVLALCNFAEISTAADAAIRNLTALGSAAAPGFMQPEGVVIYHVAGNIFFKKTLEKDEEPKNAIRR